MSGVNNAAEDDQVTVRPRSLACESYAPPISASVATPAKPWHDAAGAAGPRACRTLDAAIGRAWFTMAHASSRATVRSALPSFALSAGTGCSGRTRSTYQLPLPAGCRAACSRCGKAARPTEN